MQGCRGDYQVVRAYRLARLGNLRPKAGMHPRQGRIQRNNFKTAEGLLHRPPTPPCAGCVGLDSDAKPEFRKRDGADRNGFGRTRAEPRREVEVLAFVGNEQRTAPARKPRRSARAEGSHLARPEDLT